MKMNAKLIMLTLLASVAPAFAEYVGNFTVDDIGPMGIDFAGHILSSLIARSDVLVGMLITLVIIGLVSTIIAACLGFFSIFKKGKIW